MKSIYDYAHARKPVLIDGVDFSGSYPPQFNRAEGVEFRPTDEVRIREMIGHRLHYARVVEKMSINALSRVSGITPRQISRIERLDPKHPSYDPEYTRMPTLTTIVRLCNAMKLHPAAIMVDWAEFRYWAEESPN